MKVVAVHHYNLGAVPSTGDRRKVRPGEERREVGHRMESRVGREKNILCLDSVFF